MKDGPLLICSLGQLRIRKPAMFMMIVVTAVSSNDCAAQCPPRYNVDIIPGSNCGFFYSPIGATGISEIGEISGGGGTCAKFQSAGFAWYGALPLVYLPMPPGLAGTPLDINSSRQFAGYMSIAAGGGAYRAFFHQNGVTVDLGTLPGDNQSQAHAINESGAIVGTSTGGDLRAFRWMDGQMMPLDLPLGPNAVANDISDDGRICGWMGNSSYIDGHAFIWSAERVIDVGTVLDGAIGADGHALNHTGSMCGYSIYEDSFFTYLRRAFLWNDGRAQFLGVLPPYVSSYALDLNDSNTVVGYCDDFPVTGGTKAFVWQSGVIYALADQVPQALNLNIRIAVAINNAGQIAAYGHYPDPNGSGIIYVAMRLTPIPPLTGDLNCDWQVNVPDLLSVISSWGPCPLPPPGEPFTETCHADFNADGLVNHHDIIAVVLNWTS
jgi:probable HAF family extracellular repeat protein